MATSKSKKEILDYLWEWTESKGDWAKLLVKTVVLKEAALTDHECRDIYNEFLCLISD